MNNEEILAQLPHCGTLLCFDVPEGTEFGIDMRSWVVGPIFKGVKLIPPGPHLVCVTPAQGKHSSSSIHARTGFWLWVQPNNIYLKKWNINTETLINTDMDEDEIERYNEGVKRFDFDRFLGPYPMDTHETWQQLTHYITPTVIDRLKNVLQQQQQQKTTNNNNKQNIQENEKLNISSSSSSSLLKKKKKNIKKKESIEIRDKLQKIALMMEENETNKDIGDIEEHMISDSIPRSKNQNLDNNNNNNNTTREREISENIYTHIPKNWIPITASTPEQLTKHAFDKSALLSFLLKKIYNNDWRLLLGELQHAFATFLVGQSYEGFEQWRDMVTLLCSCEDALNCQSQLQQVTSVDYNQLFLCFTAVLHHQLKQLPSDFFIDPLSNSNFLRPLLKGYFELLLNNNNSSSCAIGNTTTTTTPLQQRGMKFQKFIEKRFAQSFAPTSITKLDEDDAPMIVEI